MGHLNLPCAKCGYPNMIIKGTTTSCFNCGEVNIFNDSFDIFSNYIQELFGYAKAIEELEHELPEQTLMERQNAIENAFTKFINDNRNINKIICTKIDDKATNIDIPKTYKLAKTAALLALSMENYLIPHLKIEILKNKQEEIRLYLQIHSFLLRALAISGEAKEAYNIEKTKEKYVESEKQFIKLINFINKSNQDNPNLKFEEEMLEAVVGKEFSILLTNITDTSPVYFIEDIENIEIKLKDQTSRKIIETKAQLLKIYEVATNFSFINEDLRNLKLYPPEIKEEHILYNIQTANDDLSIPKRKIHEIKEKFEDIKKKLIVIHCGNYLDYLKSYISEFNVRYREAQEVVDTTIINYVHKMIAEFSIESSEQFDLIEEMLDAGIFSQDSLLPKVEQQKNVLLDTAANIERFTNDLSSLAELQKLDKMFRPEIFQAIVDKKVIFDKKIFKFAKKMIDDFVELRNNNRMTIEEQRNHFSIKLMPKIEALKKLAFNKKNIELSYPILMELMVLSTKMEINSEQKVFIIIENPNSYPLSNIEASFFVPKNIMITNQLFKLDKIKPYEKKEFSLLIMPTQNGIYYIMAMVQYEDKVSKEQFWLPSVKIKITVGKPPTEQDILKELYEKYGMKDDKIKEFMEKFNPFIQEESLKEYDTDVEIQKVPVYKQDEFFEEKFQFDEDDMEYVQKNYDSNDEDDDIEIEGEDDEDEDEDDEDEDEN